MPGTLISTTQAGASVRVGYQAGISEAEADIVGTTVAEEVWNRFCVGGEGGKPCASAEYYTFSMSLAPDCIGTMEGANANFPLRESAVVEFVEFACTVSGDVYVDSFF